MPTTALPPADAAVDPTTVADHQRALVERGFTVFPSAMSDRQLAELRAAVDARILAVADAPARHGGEVYGEANLVGRAAIFRELSALPIVLAVVEGLIGDDCILSSCNLGSRKPRCAAQGLHRDTHIWGPALPWLPIPVGIQTAWCVDDFAEANGGTLLVPGSHAIPDAQPDPASAIAVEAPAGSMIAFDARTLHAGGANRTDAVRRGVLTFYIRSWLKPQTDHKRSIDPETLARSTPVEARLFGIQRQSPVETADGRPLIVPGPGATWFYGQVET